MKKSTRIQILTGLYLFLLIGFIILWSIPMIFKENAVSPALWNAAAWFDDTISQIRESLGNDRFNWLVIIVGGTFLLLGAFLTNQFNYAFLGEMRLEREQKAQSSKVGSETVDTP